MSAPRPEGIPGSLLRGPFPVGQYAALLQAELRKRARVQLFGEVWGFKRGAGPRVYFELRDADRRGALLDVAQRVRRAVDGPLADGARVVVAGGPAYYPGSRTSSPHFSFDVSARAPGRRGRPAGPAGPAAQAPATPRACSPARSACPAPRCRAPSASSPGEGGKARDDVLAGLRRRGWAGRVVWAFAPVQDRHAAPAITRALQDLAAVGAVDVIVVARGGGSLADLFCFCDETLCRTVALLAVPVIASVGHHTDRTLLDDVAAAAARRRRTPPRPPCPATATRRAPRRPAPRRPPAAARPPRRARPRARARAAVARAGAARRPPATRAAPVAARAARRRPPRPGRAPGRATRAGRSTAGARPPPPRRRPRAPRRSSGCAWRWTPTTPSARWSAATRWSSGPPAAWSPARPTPAPRGRAAALRRRRRGCDHLRGGRMSEQTTPQLRDRDRARRGDHPPAGLRRGGPARDARPAARGPRADRVLRRRARGGRRRGWRSCAWTSSSRGWSDERHLGRSCAAWRCASTATRWRATSSSATSSCARRRRSTCTATARRAWARTSSTRPRTTTPRRRPARCIRWPASGRWRRSARRSSRWRCSRPSRSTPPRGSTARGPTSPPRWTWRCARPARPCTRRWGASCAR